VKKRGWKIGRLEMDKTISFIQPSRNNLKYLKWSYESIRKNLGYRHEICMADDFSDDGTWEWMEEIIKKDQNVKIHRNIGPERLGHTILYDTLVDMATNDIVMIYHADMYALPGLDDEILKHIKPGVVVSGTRIEPPLHPDGPEKVIMDFGIEPEEFKEDELLSWHGTFPELTHSKLGKETTEGIFAPWAIYKEDFQKIGGHDDLFAPQSKEDSDIFNRFVLNGYKTIQTWRGFVYHMTCRGSRFAEGAKRNPEGEVSMIGRETDEWLTQNERSTRNFARKWSSYCLHDDYLKPYIQPKYDIGYVVKNCNMSGLQGLEPWSDSMYIDDKELVEQYIKEEQPQTKFDLKERLLKSEIDNDIVVEFDLQKLTQNDYEILKMLPEIIKDSGKVGEFTLEIFDVTITSLKTYEKELIGCDSN
jgi:glycosyltransferase involved in cell wall biosynthesis